MKNLFLLIFMLGFLFEISAQKAEIQIPFNSENFKIDGNLNEAFYKSTIPMKLTAFPEGNRQPEQETQLWICSDKDNIYIAVKCFENNIKRLFQQSGFVYNDDCVEIFLAPDAQQQNYYHLALNTLGTKYEAYRSNRIEEKKPPECKWEAATFIADTYWCAEIKIPLSLFTWGKESTLNICRERKAGKSEFSSLAILRDSSFHSPGSFLLFKREIEAGTTFIRKMSELNFIPGIKNVCMLLVDNKDENDKNIKTSLTLRADTQKNKDEISENSYKIKGLQETSISFDYLIPREQKYTDYIFSVFANDKLIFSRKAPVPELFNITLPGNIYYNGEIIPITVVSNLESSEKYHYRILLTDAQQINLTVMENIKCSKKLAFNITMPSVPAGKYFLLFQLYDSKNNIIEEIKNGIEIIRI